MSTHAEIYWDNISFSQFHIYVRNLRASKFVQRTINGLVRPFGSCVCGIGSPRHAVVRSGRPSFMPCYGCHCQCRFLDNWGCRQARFGGLRVSADPGRFPSVLSVNQINYMAYFLSIWSVFDTNNRWHKRLLAAVCILRSGTAQRNYMQQA